MKMLVNKKCKQKLKLRILKIFKKVDKLILIKYILLNAKYKKTMSEMTKLVYKN